jgi:hypothetical protein
MRAAPLKAVEMYENDAANAWIKVCCLAFPVGPPPAPTFEGGYETSVHLWLPAGVLRRRPRRHYGWRGGMGDKGAVADDSDDGR